MRYRFWMWVHDTLERSWHWVYYNKLRTVEDHMKHTMVREPYNVTYVYRNSATGATIPVSPKGKEAVQ